MRTISLLPAIDLRGGKCVRLERGDPALEKAYDDDPVARARAFVAAGARGLHVVDLDGALGSGENQSALTAICRAVDVPVQTGGGVRTLDDARTRLEGGAAAVVIGTVLVDDVEAARIIVSTFGDRIVAGIDARGDRVATRGWQHDAGVSRDDLVRTVAGWGVGRIVYTEIGRDGMGSGYDIGALAHVATLCALNITASGGAKTIADLIDVRDLLPHTVDAAIIGRALYEGTLDLEEALATVGYVRGM
jgi:phosphoribosylformimino-5-aminoimidazole carboxamide ribotide isomerase